MALAPERPTLRARRPAVGATPRTGRTVTDAALVRAAGQRDERALAEIHERYRAPLERYCRTIVLQHADAQDAAQAALAAGLSALADGRAEPESLRAWLYKIAHREAVAVLRRRPPATVGDPSDDALSALLPSAPDDTSTRAELQELLDDLHALPERQRCALVLHELAGLRHDEIAGALGLASAGAARQAVHAARTTLRRRRTSDLHVLFPAGPALAFVAGGAGAGAGAAGLAAAGGAGGLGAIGAWVAGAGVAAQCAAVCAAIGAIGAGSLAVVETPRVVGGDRPAAQERRAAERPRTPAPTIAAAPTSAPEVASSAAAVRSDAAERRTARERAARRRDAAREREAERSRSAPEPASTPAAPEPDVVGVDVSGDAADPQTTSVPTPPASAAPPPATATPTPPAARRTTGVDAAAVVVDSDVGGLVDETDAAASDVVVDAG